MRGRLWRAANPALPKDKRQSLVDVLMAARRAVRAAKDNPGDMKRARARVDAAKHELGERGPVWWHDGAPDLNQRMAKTSIYADWYAEVGGGAYLQPAACECCHFRC